MSNLLYSDLTDTLPANSDFIMTLYYVKPNPCFQFRELQLSQSSFEYDIALWIENKDAYALCPDVIILDSLKRAMNLKPGNHVFRFRTYNDFSVRNIFAR
jgi:hypothetical protein